MTGTIGRRLAAEGLGAALLLAIVVGSGIMGERLAQGNAAVALLANAIATGAGLFVLIVIFAPVSGAHFNPAVTLVFALRRVIAWRAAAAYCAAQAAGAVAGVWIAHLMFAEPVLQVSTRARGSGAEAFSEAIATFGLMLAILGAGGRRERTAACVGLYIAAAYWFTGSTSFANPAVTAARSLSDTFSGIAPSSAPLFIACQIAGALAAAGFAAWLWRPRAQTHARKAPQP